MRFELGALNPNPGGTGHFMGESGIEAAARRGLERQKRERQQAEQARSAAANDAISQTTTIVDDVEKGKGDKEELSKRTSTTDVEESPSSESREGDNNNNSGNSGRKRSSWGSMKDKIFGKWDGASNAVSSKSSYNLSRRMLECYTHMYICSARYLSWSVHRATTATTELETLLAFEGDKLRL